MSQPLAMIGVPTSVGAFSPGQEQAPAALRNAGLLELLSEAGIATRDDGDRPVWRWQPDRTNRRAQNLGAVVEIGNLRCLHWRGGDHLLRLRGIPVIEPSRAERAMLGTAGAPP